ncbi:hypothetical protein, partial [Aminobacter sp. J44]|uniref:hypothetical protein n=1 Tax=Aminobacter sp. J44 TaxID=935262 RepID=UPI001AEF0CFA
MGIGRFGRCAFRHDCRTFDLKSNGFSALNCLRTSCPRGRMNDSVVPQLAWLLEDRADKAFAAVEKF